MITVHGARRREGRRRSRCFNAGMSLTIVGRTWPLMKVTTVMLSKRRLAVKCLLGCVPANIFALRSQHLWYFALLSSSVKGVNAGKCWRDLLMAIHVLEGIFELPSDRCIRLTDLSGDCR
jgi:hypothetical protein